MGRLRFELEYPSPYDDVDGPQWIVSEIEPSADFQQTPCLGCGEHILLTHLELAEADRHYAADSSDLVLEVRAGHQIQNLEMAPTLLCVGCRIRRILEVPS